MRMRSRSAGSRTAWSRPGEVARPGFRTAIPERTRRAFLKLDASRARAELGWKPRLHLGEALDWLVDWYKAQHRGENMQAFTLQQFRRYDQLTRTLA